VNTALRIAVFEPHDQPLARSLLLEGLGARWGFIDESLNPDLDDIGEAYRGGYFACAWRAGELVGTGAFLPLAGELVTIQLQRVSVATSQRRAGVGRALVTHLLEEAGRRGSARAMLETNATWDDAILFWEQNGFSRYDLRDGEIYLERGLDA
jgi:GNAT superfamily N-acetyltransferase